VVLIGWRLLRTVIGIGTRIGPGEGSSEEPLVSVGRLSLHPAGFRDLGSATTSYVLSI